MTRTALISLFALIATLFLGAAPAEAANRAFSKEIAGIRKQFVADAKDAQRTFLNAAGAFEKTVRTGGDSAQAAIDYGSALAFYGTQIIELTDAVADELADASMRVMADTGNPDEPGAVAGDFGATDKIHAKIQKDLDKLRKGALTRTKRFASTLRSKGGQRSDMRIVLAPWSFRPRAVPTPDETLLVADRSLQFWGAVSSRADDGRVTVSVFGEAPFLLNEQFDVRILGETGAARAIGSFLRDGGMTVTRQDTWRATTTLNDPFSGDGYDPGNRVLHFGVEPRDIGQGMLDPGRLQHAGGISIP